MRKERFILDAKPHRRLGLARRYQIEAIAHPKRRAAVRRGLVWLPL
jgi:hypothetical protein